MPSPEPIHDPLQQDPMEAIYALNIGDFVTDSFMSDELLDKISTRLGDDPKKLKAQLEELIQIYSMDKTLAILGYDASTGFVFYDSMCKTLADMFYVDACHLFQVTQKDAGHRYLSLTGTSRPLTDGKRLDIGISIPSNDVLSDVMSKFETATFDNVPKVPNWHPIAALGQAQSHSVMLTPLVEGGKVPGVLVFERYAACDYPPAFHPALVALADVTAKVFVTTLRLQEIIAEAQNLLGQEPLQPNRLLSLRAQITESIADLGIHQQDFVEQLSHAIDARNRYTQGHSKSVATVARAIADAMDLNEKTADLVYYAGLCGSIGKVHIPPEVLNKSGKLNRNELEELRNHPNVGVSLLGKINFLSETRPYVQSQNERWDGTGSPEGLAGKSIPLGARILAVADAYFAMTQERPYRGEPLSYHEAVKQIQAEAGSRWDPLVVSALATIPPDSLR